MMREFHLPPEATIVSLRSIAANVTGVALSRNAKPASRMLVIEKEGHMIRIAFEEEQLTFDAKLIEKFDIARLSHAEKAFLAATITFGCSTESIRYSLVVIHKSRDLWIRDLAVAIGEIIECPPTDVTYSDQYPS